MRAMKISNTMQGEVRRQKMARRKKTCVDKRDNVRVTQSPKKKYVCTINIKIKY